VVLQKSLHPALLAWKQSQGQEGVLHLGDGAEGYPGGHLEQGSAQYRKEKKCSRGIQFLDLQPPNTPDIQRCCDKSAIRTL